MRWSTDASNAYPVIQTKRQKIRRNQFIKPMAPAIFFYNYFSGRTGHSGSVKKAPPQEGYWLLWTIPENNGGNRANFNSPFLPIYSGFTFLSHRILVLIFIFYSFERKIPEICIQFIPSYCKKNCRIFFYRHPCFTTNSQAGRFGLYPFLYRYFSHRAASLCNRAHVPDSRK